LSWWVRYIARSIDEAEFVAGLDQAAEGVLHALKATNSWKKAFGPAPGSISSK
jgi:hypothetical protein